MGEQRGQTVVIAVAELGGRDRVVLVDDRHTPQLEQPSEGLPSVQVLSAVDEIVGVEQHLSSDEPMALQHLVVDLHESRLADRRDGLQSLHVTRARGESNGGHTSGDGA